MNIKYKDIDAISYALCHADAMLDFKIEELEQKGFNNVTVAYKSKKRRTEKGNGFTLKDKERTSFEG